MPEETKTNTWGSFFIQQDDALSFVTIVLALVDAAPLSDLPVVTRIDVPLSKANREPWYRSQDEADRIEEIMAALEETVAQPPPILARLSGTGMNRVLLAGRRFRDHRCELYYYCATPISRAVLGAVQRQVPGVNLSVRSLDDPEWKVFRRELSPRSALAPLILTWRQLEEREARGDDACAVRVVDHIVAFPDATGRDRFVEEMRAMTAGSTWTFRAVDRSEGERRFTVECRVFDDLRNVTVEPHVIALATHAERHGGVHEGWGAPVVPASK